MPLFKEILSLVLFRLRENVPNHGLRFQAHHWLMLRLVQVLCVLRHHFALLFAEDPLHELVVIQIDRLLINAFQILSALAILDVLVCTLVRRFLVPDLQRVYGLALLEEVILA